MADSHRLETANYQALAEFRYQIRRFLRFSEEAARQAGLEPQQHQLMLAVKSMRDGGGPRIAYLAERLQLQHHSAVELVDRMVKRGLIQRTRGDKDRREAHVKLTPRGQRILQRLTVRHRDELRTAAPALVSALKKVMVTMRRSAPAPAESSAATKQPQRRSSR